MAQQDFERLLNIIKQLEAELEHTNQLTDAIQDRFSATGAESFNRLLAQMKINAQSLSSELATANEQLRQMQEAASKPISPGLAKLGEKYQRGYTSPEEPAPSTPKGLYTIPSVDTGLKDSEEQLKNMLIGETKSAAEKLQADVRTIEAQNKYADMLALEVANREKAIPAEQRIRNNLVPPDGGVPDAMGKTISEMEQVEKARLESAKNALRSEQRYAEAIAMAEKQGYTLDDLKNIRTRGTGNIQQLQFQKYNEQGVKQNLDIFSSPSGRATAGISNQFRTFGQGVVRDIGELTKWSIALAAVYGPLRKLGDLTQEMIQNQTKLAEATVSVNSAFTGQSEIFNIAADSANKSGEAISGVIDAFTAAYRATGGVGDNVTRLTTAQKLLNDALILSKLSSLDQATAIDTLSAAVRQTGGNFDNTTSLLDKWVRVTKIANVDLATLATGFATLGDAAENAGLNADELNGILATLAESTNQSGQEVANTSRAIISGFQSDQGIKALEQLGIATKDATGNMRSLKDVMQEIASLRSQKIIDDTQFSKLTLAIGGGTRRQAAVATFLENYQRAIDVANQSANAQGDAQAALAKQLDTVQTSLTRLANAFTRLAQNLGTEGGFLSIIQASVSGLTGLVTIFDKLVSLLGKATPAMVAFVAASLALKSKGQGSIQEALFGTGQRVLSQDVELGRLNQVTGYTPPGDRVKNFAQNNILGNNVSSGVFQGLALSALPAILNLTNKNDKYGGTKAAADVVGGVGGGIIGALVAGSPIVGAAIGNAVAEAFVNATVARKTDIFGYQGAATLAAPGKTPGESAANPEEALRQAEANLYKSIGFGSEGLGKFLTTDIQNRQKSVFTNLNKAIQERDKDALESFLKGNGKNTQYVTGLSNDEIRKAYAENRQLTPNTQISAYNSASDEARKQYDSALAAYKAQNKTEGGLNTPFTDLVGETRKQFGDIAKSLQNASRTQLDQSRLQGNTTGAEYARQATAITGVDTKSLQYYAAFGDTFLKINKDAKDAGEALKIFNSVVVQGGDEGTSSITALEGEIEQLYNILNSPALSPEDLKDKFGFNSIDEVQKKYDELKTTAANTLNDLYNQQQLSSLKVPQIQGDVGKPYTSKEEQNIEQRTKVLQDQFYQGFLKIPDAMYAALKKSWEDFAVAIKDSGQTFYEKVSETDPQFRNQAVDQLKQEGALGTQSPFNIQQLDITSGQGANLQGTIDYYSKYLSQNFPQYQQKPEEFGVIFSDYVTSVLHGDNLAVKLALDKLVDINQKQLDGQYNIPEGATFWVPLQAAYYRPKNENGGMGGPTIDPTSLNGNTSATDNNTTALQNLTTAMQNRKEDQVDKWGQSHFGNKPPLTPNQQSDRLEQIRATRNVSTVDRSYDRLEEIRATRQIGEPKDSGFGTFVQQLIDGLKSFFSGSGTGSNYNGTGHGGPTGPFGPPNGVPTTPTGFSTSQALSQQAPQTVQARLDLRFDNNTQLVVDGRVLATVIAPYLSSDLLRLEAAQGTITKRYVI